MDGTVIGLFLFATFLGGFTSGLTGFAAGLVVSGIWLHIITPLQTAVLIAAYGVVNQAYGVWKVRHALQWRRILPFVIGGAVGVPLGAYLVTYLNPAYLRIGVGVLLISSELDELMAVADRVLVMYRGRIMGACVPDASQLNLQRERIGAWMAGQTA